MVRRVQEVGVDWQVESLHSMSRKNKHPQTKGGLCQLIGQLKSSRPISSN